MDVDEDPYQEFVESQDAEVMDIDEDEENPNFDDDPQWGKDGEEEQGEEEPGSLVVLKGKKSKTGYPGLVEILKKIYREQVKVAKAEKGQKFRDIVDFFKKGDRDIEEEDIKPWEFLYDEEYDPNMDALMKFEKSREFMRKKTKSSQQLFREVVEEWNEERSLVKKILDHLLGEKLDLNGKLSEVQMATLFHKINNNCRPISESLFIENPMFLEQPLMSGYSMAGWIERWKLPTHKGGRGLSVHGKMFLGKPGIRMFRDIVSQAIQTNRDQGWIKSQVRDAVGSELIQSGKYNFLEDVFKEGIVEQELFQQMGQVVVKPSQTTLEDLNQLVNQLTLEENDQLEYTTDDLIMDLQNKMKVSMNKMEKNQFVGNMNRLKGKNVMLKDLFYDQKGNPLIKRETTEQTDIERLAVFMEDLSLKEVSGPNSDFNPLAIGTMNVEGYLTSRYHPNVHFIRPYKDPHFTFLNETVETWSPKVHYVTGLPVFTQKEEILRYTLQGNIVYIKLQKVAVNIKGRTTYIMYFRKFVDFLDYLKSWQESFVTRIIQIGIKFDKMIINKYQISKKNDVRKIALMLEDRRRMLTKVKDIKSYFLEKATEGVQVEKMEIYINDQVVESVLHPNQGMDGPILDFINDNKKKLLEQLKILQGKVNLKDKPSVLYDLLIQIQQLKTIMDYYVPYFQDEEFVICLKDNKLETDICIKLHDHISQIYTELQGKYSTISSTVSIVENTSFNIREICTSKNIENLKRDFSDLNNNLFNISNFYNSLISGYNILFSKFNDAVFFFEKFIGEPERVNGIITRETIINEQKRVNDLESRINYVVDKVQKNIINEYFNLETAKDIECLPVMKQVVEFIIKLITNNTFTDISVSNFIYLVKNTKIATFKINREVAEIYHYMVIQLFTYCVRLFDISDESIGQFAASPLSNAPLIIEILKNRYNLKLSLREIYEKYKKVSERGDNPSNMTKEEKIRDVELRLLDIYGPRDPRFQQELDRLTREIEEYENSSQQRKQQMKDYRDSFKNLRLEEFSKYVVQCTKREKKLVDFFKSLEEEFRRRDKLFRRDYQQQPRMIKNIFSREEQNTMLYYNQIMTYLSGCLKMSKRVK